MKRSKSIPKLLHSDQWSEYRSYEYFDTLKRYNISASMSKKSSPWENQSQESFYGKFKFELWNLNRFDSIEKAIEAVYLKIYYYNNYRIHTTLKMSPKEYQKREQKLS
jgi:transposase InsO family protein